MLALQPMPNREPSVRIDDALWARLAEAVTGIGESVRRASSGLNGARQGDLERAAVRCSEAEQLIATAQTERTHDGAWRGAQPMSPTVLLVDDEPLSRAAARRVLRSLGCHVLEAEGAGQARTLVESEQQIDLLISDVNMPEMDGFELARRLRSIQPELRTLYICGYPADTIEDAPAGAQIVEKPFTYDDLAERVKSVLEAKSD